MLYGSAPMRSTHSNPPQKEVKLRAWDTIPLWKEQQQKMTVFDANAQMDTGKKNLSESAFAYLNRSAKPGSVACRAVIEEWMSNVPASGQEELRARFRSGDNVQFGTAFQELFLHEFLRRQNCALDFHPAIPGSSTKPDFRVRPAIGDNFILEARTATDIASGPENNPRGDRIRDFLRQMKLDAHKLGIDELTVGTSDLPQRALRKHIVDAIAADPGNSDGVVRIPQYSTSDGWRIRLTAFTSNRYGSSRSTTVMQEAWGKTWTGPSYPLRDALKRKAGKYGEPSVPYIVAINSADVMLTDRDFEETLFGVRPGVTIAGMTNELARGFWGRRACPITGVSAQYCSQRTCGRLPS
jgi:hypothetical protein